MTRFSRATLLVDALAWAAPAGRPSALLALGAVGIVFSAMATGAALWPEDQLPSVIVPISSADVLAARDRSRLRCASCGVVEAIHRTEAAGDLADSYEFAVRLPDGSLRHSVDSRPGRWQVGDRMMLIGSAADPAP
jgi:hypothetical protein